MKKEIYRCDICDSNGDNYFAYNSNYGYCDNPKCKIIAENKNTKHCREMFDYDIENGNFESAMNEMEMGNLKV